MANAIKTYVVTMPDTEKIICKGTRVFCSQKLGIATQTFSEYLTKTRKQEKRKFNVRTLEEVEVNHNCRFMNKNKCAILIEGSLCLGCNWFKPIRDMTLEEKIIQESETTRRRKIISIDSGKLKDELLKRDMSIYKFAIYIDASYPVAHRALTENKCSAWTFEKIEGFFGKKFAQTIRA